MGLPEGWVTDCDLTRTEQLKACGNGVVPQQAELALRILLGDQVETHEPLTNLPTPTPSDVYIGNLESKQRKPGSMHSVNLPVAVRMVSAKIEAGQEKCIKPDPHTDNPPIGNSKSTAEERQ